jgi:hypothetical protein
MQRIPGRMRAGDGMESVRLGGLHSLPALMAGDRPDLELCTGCTGGR